MVDGVAALGNVLFLFPNTVHETGATSCPKSCAHRSEAIMRATTRGKAVGEIDKVAALSCRARNKSRKRSEHTLIRLSRRPLFRWYSECQKNCVADRKNRRGNYEATNQRYAHGLDHDCRVVGMPDVAIRSRGCRFAAGYHDHARVPFFAERRDRPVGLNLAKPKILANQDWGPGHLPSGRRSCMFRVKIPYRFICAIADLNCPLVIYARRI
jgi:hypothetical protein